MAANRVILVADDVAMFRELESVFLARSGTVITASGGHEALELLRTQRTDIAVIDLHMPDLPGDEVCRAVRQDAELRDLPLVLVVPGDTPEDHERAVRAGADDILTKPIDRLSLNGAVARLLQAPGERSRVRVAVEDSVRVRLSRDNAIAYGNARNLSRGGIFVESPGRLPVDTEVRLDFRLPEGEASISPTARVVWQRPRAEDEPPGMGLEFLALARRDTERLAAFVYERAQHAALEVLA